MGAGYEIGKAEEWSKTVLVLFRNNIDRKLSAMIDGTPCVEVINYNEPPTVRAAIDIFVNSLNTRT